MYVPKTFVYNITEPQPVTLVAGTFTIVNTDVNTCLAPYENANSPEYNQLANDLTIEVCSVK